MWEWPSGDYIQRWGRCHVRMMSVRKQRKTIRLERRISVEEIEEVVEEYLESTSWKVFD